MKLPRLSTPRFVLAAATAGAVACGLGTLATYWARTGTTPPWLFERFGALRSLRSAIALGGVPIELLGAAWFTALAALLLGRRRITPAIWATVAFGSGVLLGGFAAAKSLDYQFANWTMNTAAVAALVIVVASGVERLASAREFLAGTIRLVRQAGGRPLIVAAVVPVLAVAIGGTLALRASIERMSPREATTRNFLGWFAAQPRPDDPQLRQEGRVRVVTFTDYECPFCATGVPKAEQIVQELRSSNPMPIEFVVRDFPLDRSCNPAFRGSLHPTACEAAASVRFVRDTQGMDEARRLEDWLYRRAGRLTAGDVGAYLDQRGVREAFLAARPEILRRVQADAVYGFRHGARATPAFFVNGIKLPHGGYLEMAIRYELTRIASPQRVEQLISDVVSEMLEGR